MCTKKCAKYIFLNWHTFWGCMQRCYLWPWRRKQKRTENFILQTGYLPRPPIQISPDVDSEKSLKIGKYLMLMIRRTKCAILGHPVYTCSGIYRVAQKSKSQPNYKKIV